MDVVNYLPDNDAVNDTSDDTYLLADAQGNFNFRAVPDTDIPMQEPDRWYLRLRASIDIPLAPWGWILLFDGGGQLRISQTTPLPTTYEAYYEQGSPEWTFLTGVRKSPIHIIGAQVAGAIDQPAWVKLHEFYLQAVRDDRGSDWNAPPGVETIRAETLTRTHVATFVAPA